MPRADVRWDELPLARSGVDRAAVRRTEPELLVRLREDPGTRILLVNRGLVATTTRDPVVAPGKDPADARPVPLEPELTLDLVTPAQVAVLPADDAGWAFLGASGETAYLSLVLDQDASDGTDLEGVVVPSPGGTLAAGRMWSHLRDVGARLDAVDAGLASTAVALAAWHSTHVRCPRCGEPTVQVQAGWVRRCVADGSEHYPRTDPAVIMAVVDEADRILLGHAAHWPEHRFSTLAGYVEPGESAEQAVRREVAEEVGVTVGQVEYRASQTWPFPASLMLAFRARAMTTPIEVDGSEVTEARWFTRDELAAAVRGASVLLPMRASIALALIEEWFGGPLTDSPAGSPIGPVA